MKHKKIKIKKIVKKIRQEWYLSALLFLSLLLIASVIRYGLRTYQIPVWDEQHYMRMATEFYRLLQHPTWSTPHEMLQIVPFRQPGYPLLIVPFYFLFGLSKAYFWAQVTNGILYIATIWGIYFIAKLYLSRLASFLAALMFAFYGWPLLHLHLSYSETAVSALSVLTILFLLKSEYFQKRKYVFLFGLFFGLAMLMKWMSLVYICGPLLYVAYQVLVKKLLFKKKILISIFIGFFVAFLIAFYPYYTNFSWYFENWFSHQPGSVMWQMVGKDERNPLSVYSLTFYLNTFAQLGIVYFILFFVGLVLAFKKKSKVKPILLAFLVGYIFSVYALLKAERHIVPIFPYIAILSAAVFDYIKPSWRKTAMVLFVVTLSVFSFLGSVWGKGPMKQSLAALPIDLPFGQVKKIYLTTISRPPYIYKISGKEILEFLEKDSKKNGIHNPKVLSLFYYRPLDEPLMTYNLYNLEKPFEINNYLGTVIKDPQNEAEGLLKNVFDYDYVLIKSGKKIDDYFPKQNYYTIQTLAMLFETHLDIDKYYEKKAEIWINQDSSVVTVFKNKKKLSKEEFDTILEDFIFLAKAENSKIEKRK